MRKMNVLMASLALPGLLLAGASFAGAKVAARAEAGSGGDNAALCRIKVNRSAANAGQYSVLRDMDNGKCTCIVTTGPKDQGGTAEEALAALLVSQRCDDAALAPAGAGSGGIAGIDDAVLIGGIILLGGGVGAAIGTGGGSGSP